MHFFPLVVPFSRSFAWSVSSFRWIYVFSFFLFGAPDDYVSLSSRWNNEIVGRRRKVGQASVSHVSWFVFTTQSIWIICPLRDKIILFTFVCYHVARFTSAPSPWGDPNTALMQNWFVWIYFEILGKRPRSDSALTSSLVSLCLEWNSFAKQKQKLR